jgi:diguanylate cyclase (GGDEF)-like protein
VEAGTAYQTLNTVAFFLMLACMSIVFSTSIQDTERQLRLKNQILYKEAGTDPLTGLPNRRAMIEQMEKFYKENNNQPFSVAIADIDLFKQVNDTYGHNCGDYTLVKLTELFVQHSMGRYSVCRWGGEEFFFFIPGMNLDEAGTLMEDLRCAVEKMRLEYEGHMFSITITIGVNEFDFASPFEDLLNAADEKLYKGKSTGRNRVET